jgi:hypothetical protein
MAMVLGSLCLRHLTSQTKSAQRFKIFRLSTFCLSQAVMKLASAEAEAERIQPGSDPSREQVCVCDRDLHLSVK